MQKSLPRNSAYDNSLQCRFRVIRCVRRRASCDKQMKTSAQPQWSPKGAELYPGWMRFMAWSIGVQLPPFHPVWPPLNKKAQAALLRRRFYPKTSVRLLRQAANTLKPARARISDDWFWVCIHLRSWLRTSTTLRRGVLAEAVSARYWLAWARGRLRVKSGSCRQSDRKSARASRDENDAISR